MNDKASHYDSTGRQLILCASLDVGVEIFCTEKWSYPSKIEEVLNAFLEREATLRGKRDRFE
jgi:hypothetical protein